MSNDDIKEGDYVLAPKGMQDLYGDEPIKVVYHKEIPNTLVIYRNDTNYLSIGLTYNHFTKVNIKNLIGGKLL